MDFSRGRSGFIFFCVLGFRVKVHFDLHLLLVFFVILCSFLFLCFTCSFIRASYHRCSLVSFLFDSMRAGLLFLYACLFVYMFHLANKYTGHKSARLRVEIRQDKTPLSCH